MRSGISAASAALFLTSALVAQGSATGTDPNLRAPVPGQATASSVAVPQANVALPTAAATSMGNYNNIFGVAFANQRYQQINSGASVGPARVFFAHAYRFLNATYTGGLQTIEIKLATTTVGPTSITTNMTTNITGTQTTVFKGTYNYPNMVPNTNPADWKIIFPWMAPWLWTAPTGQNLGYEFLNSSTSSLSYYVDAFQNDPSVERCWGTGITATTAIATHPSGLSICLFTTPVPPFASFDVFGRGCPGTGGKAGVVLPASMRTAIGNSNNIYGVAYFNQRYHQIFEGSQIGTARVLNGHAFRPGPRSDPAQAIANVTILMGSTKNAPSSISSTFASNINGALPQVTVFSGTINYPQMVPSTDPTQFLISVPWSRSFVWTNPTNEHLLYEYQNASTSGGSYYPDAIGGDANVSRLWGTGPAATTGSIGTSYGVVFCFSYSGSGSSVPAMGNKGSPLVGKTFDVLVSDAKTTPGLAVLLWGFSDTTWGAINLPWALDPLGAKGCFLLVSIDLLGGSAINASGQGSVTIGVPNDVTLYKLAMFFQWAVFDAAANALGLAFSTGGKAVIGGI